MGIENLGKMARLLTLTLALLLCSAFFLAPIRAEEEDDSSLEDVGVDDDVEKEAKEEMDRMDADKNGKVSLEEISTYFRTEFYSDEDMADSTDVQFGRPQVHAMIGAFRLMEAGMKSVQPRIERICVAVRLRRVQFRDSVHCDDAEDHCRNSHCVGDVPM